MLLSFWMLSPVVALDTQQQPGPAFGQQLVQNVTQVQSTGLPPGGTLVPQSEYGLAETVPGKSIPQLKCGVFGPGIME